MSRQIISVALGAALCTAGCIQGRSHPSTSRPDGRSMSRNLDPVGPNAAVNDAKQRARLVKMGHLDQAAEEALKAGDYAEAEADARQSVSLGVGAGRGQEHLALALYAQGKDQDALQAYKAIANEGGVFARNLVPYAVLLLKSGRWAEAVAAYNTLLPYFSDRDMVEAYSHFSPNVPQPKELAVALHILQGMNYTGDPGDGGSPYHSPYETAMHQFAQAVRLAPNSPLTNYYYGFGWQQLGPKSPMKAAYASQAKEAFLKAATLGSGDVKKKAEEALRGG